MPELKDPGLAEDAELPEPSRLPEPQLPARRRGPLTTWQYTAAAATLGLVLTAGVVAAAGPWDSGQRTAERARAASWEADGGADHGRGKRQKPQPAPPAPDVLSALGAPQGSAPAPTKSELADVLAPLLKDPSLGTLRTASVVDAVTGEELYGARQGEPVTPASTTKIATAVAALTALGPDHRIATTTVADPGANEVVLVGAGDPTLDTDALRDLAKATAKSLHDDPREGKVKLSYDTSLYSGPALHPIGPNENIAPVSALMLNEGRLDDSTSGPAPRSADPAAAAAQRFAEILREEGVRLDGAPRPGKAGADAVQLGSTSSAPLSALVERMLTHSDNDIAEALVRQTALASGEPASFDGAAKAVDKRLKELQLPLDGTKFADGSGLDRADRVTARLLTALLAKAADPARPELRSALTGLPVAGFTGTLKNRYDSDGAAPGTGLVRAKTGTLTGINTLAGSVVDADGRLLLFAFTASGTTAPQSAQATLDRLAATVANCGCR
ncbi:D-alanyl-D-alanine carboxypeptidase/D-alanyl-D-alanine-endopeptidase [Streptomyces sp. NPDC050418]|uniref:D-alanyl-D-alanine carboxypeptidase/D-alanyl-D-alanine endopeptidase n=1 Tax=Streptomyces sp. NPDC050418 TaxID=3365612 RepID=UPI0037934AB9